MREFEKRDQLEASHAASIFGANKAADEVWSLFICILKVCFKVLLALETKRKALAFKSYFTKILT